MPQQLPPVHARCAVVLNHAVDFRGNRYYVPKAEADFLSELRASVDHLSLVSPVGSHIPYDGPIKSNINIFDIPSGFYNHTGSSAPKKSYLYARSVGPMLSCIRCHDFFYVFLPGHLSLIISILCTIVGKPFGVYVRGDWHSMSGIHKLAVNSLLRRAVFAIATGLSLTKRTKAIQPNCAAVVPMTAFPLLHDICVSTHNIDQPVSLVFVGGLGDRKGIFDLLAACHILLEHNLPFSLEIVGTQAASRISELVDFIHASSLDQLVTLRGRISNGDELRYTLAQKDLFILPTYGEGFPRAIYEAMSVGLPVITTAFPGGDGFLHPFRNYYPVAVGNPKSIADAVLRLSCDSPLRRSLGETGRRDVRAMFACATDLTHSKQVLQGLRCLTSLHMPP